jgi:hypothetical protein
MVRSHSDAETRQSLCTIVNSIPVVVLDWSQQLDRSVPCAMLSWIGDVNLYSDVTVWNFTHAKLYEGYGAGDIATRSWWPLLLLMNHTVLTPARVWQDRNNPLRLRASRLDGGASSPLPIAKVDKRNITEWQNERKKLKEMEVITPLPPLLLLSPEPSAHFITPHHLGGNFPTSVATRMSTTTWSHSSLENSSEICTFLHLPAFQPVAFPWRFV